MNRRKVLLGGSIGGLGMAVLPWSRVLGANDTVNIGVIGCNGMGFSNLRSMLSHANTRCIALCDVDQRVLERQQAEVIKISGHTPRLYADYRALLDDADVDAVIIGTPDHWHCLQMVDASAAGKHVYVEKPLANTIAECELMISAQEKYQNVVQVGQWQRSGAHWQSAMDYLHSGALGPVRTVKSWAYMDWFKILKPLPDEPVPDGVDYDMWLGPAPRRPFNPNRFHFTFRWFWDYAGGLMTDWGVHMLDIVLWGMQADYPQRVMSSGGNFAYPDSAMETPDTQQAIYQFADFTMIWEHAVGVGLGPFQRSHGVAFIGNNGTLVVDRQGWEIFPEVERSTGLYKVPAMPARKVQPAQRGLNQHTENFLDCIRHGGQPRCDIRTGSLAAVNAHLGNVALRTGATLDWDAESATFRGHRAANKLIKPVYRRPWRLPDV